MSNRRKLRAIQIIIKGGVKKISDSTFLVQSESQKNKWYRVEWNGKDWTCDCPDFAKRKKKCKHIYAVIYYQLVQNVALGCKKINSKACPKCGRDDEVVKKGFRYNKSGPVQRFYCKRCGIKFTDRTGFERMKRIATVVVMALDLYFRGLSLRQVAQHIESVFGVRVTHVTVRNWIKKYVRLVDEFISGFKVQTSGRWHADETVLRVRDEHMLVWSLLDSETRLIIAMHISKYRGEKEAIELLRKGKLVSCEVPDELITDGLQSYAKAVEKEFSDCPVVHIQSSLRKGLNNKIERFFKDLKIKSKASGSFNSEEGLKNFADGYRIYHNFIKEHKSLNDKTPAQASGLIKDKLGWMDLIILASLRN